MVADQKNQAKRISYIAAAVAALRRRVDALHSQASATEPEAEGGDGAEPPALRPEDIFVAEAVMAESKNLREQLRPLAGLAAEFKVKWDKQKAQLMTQRQGEIGAYLRQESEAAANSAELATEEEMRALAHNSEQTAQEAAERMGAGHLPDLQSTVNLWRSKVRGADAVKPSDVDKALRQALQRVADWAADEERHIMNSWTEELSWAVGQAHGLDEEALTAAEDTQSARRAVLDGALQRHWKALQACRAELQERISEGTQELHEVPGSLARRTPAQSAAVAAAMGKAARNKLALARNEALAAMDAQRRSAESMVDAAARKEQFRAECFESTMHEVGPQLKSRFEDALNRLRLAAKEAEEASMADDNPQNGQRRVGSHGSSPSTSQPQGSQGRQSIVPGRSRDPRISRFEFGGRRMSSSPMGDGPRRSSAPDLAASMDIQGLGGAAPPGEDLPSDVDSSDSGGESREVALVRMQRTQRVNQLRKHLQAAQAGLARGDWKNGDWRTDLFQAAAVGKNTLRDAEASLEGQAGVMRSHTTAEEDMQLFTGAFTQLAQLSKHHVRTIKEEMTKTRNVKAGLAATRANYARSIILRAEQDTPGLEREAMPLISKLSREAETCLEVGMALKRGADRFPVAVVAGAWRRAVAAALPLLPRIWEGTGTTQEEQQAFVNKLLAIVAKTGDGARQFRQEPLRRRGLPGGHAGYGSG